MDEQIQRRKSISYNFKNLSRSQAKMIDEALGSVGNFGEVHLVVSKGRLRFLVTQRSFDAQKYRPGEIRKV